ncbi:MAG TPA: 2,3-bisphosphoglycerate-independent phosphoglycerate mutase [Candidatus Woesebacteria bacterium]|nr:2,3-bisphosphoglycerate-independent phosphoglycerate mutase [Candidatus Woesebacteria bacterium]
MKKPVVYLILDGWGIAPAGPGNAVSLAQKPTFDYLWNNYPHTEIGAGGEAIGLWPGHQGSSEIGHLIIGAGRNVYLPQGIVAKAIQSGEIFTNKAYSQAMDFALKNHSTLHLAGLMSNSGVHSYDLLTHALIKMAAQKGIKDIVVHSFTDGRDTEVKDAPIYLERLNKVFQQNGVGRVGTIMGRYWVMDRDHRWERVEKAYHLLVNGQAEFKANSAEEAIQMAYDRKETDEFISPTVIGQHQIKDNDVLIWTNFRTDRAIEITQALIEDNFNYFNRGQRPHFYFTATFKYYDEMKAPFAFERQFPTNTLGEIISRAGLKQFRVTETEKWIYVTTIFSGMREAPFEGEDRLLIESDKIPTYDLQPKMHTMDIAQAAVKAINSDQYHLIVINFNNPDIIGHTGNIPAAVIGIEECDKGLALLVEAVKTKHGLLIVSADHGNAESMLTSDGQPETQHSANNVPFIIVNDDPQYKNIKLKSGGALKDVTPTILEILGIPQPTEMTGKSLIKPPAQW